ncbi:MAG: SpoIID/LytB domain-containing protein [Gemmatimonadales bacterium]|nr:SpoIID/LytB domain-containing protein [Gemmatimonadales bacterium]
MKNMRLLVFLGAMTALVLGLGVSGCAGPKRFSPVSPVQQPAGRTLVDGLQLVGVGLAEQKTSLTVSATGACLVLDGRSGQRLARLDGGEVELTCRRSGDRVVWQSGQRKGIADVVVLQPLDPGYRVGYGDHRYRGEFLILPTPASLGLTLVNNVELENYLRGVVPWEIGRHGRDRMAALEAQAVAARTYTISHLKSRSSRGFDVFASVMDQVYRGSADEDAFCNEAIDQTAGLILRYGGKEIEAYYSACCGGVTSRIEEVWAREGMPYLVSHVDAMDSGEPFCSDYRYYHWREEWTAGRLEEILQTTLPEYLAYMSEPARIEWAGSLFIPRDAGGQGAVPGGLLDLEILDRTTSGRVSHLAVRTEAGEYRVRGDRVRWVLRPESGNPAILRSARFEVELIHRDGRLAEVATRGRGYGHGIGLCQAGSLVMAERGYTFREILAHYYPGVSPTVGTITKRK